MKKNSLSLNSQEDLPKVFITLKAIKKIHFFTLLVSGEITGLGIVERSNNDLVITDVFILKQEVSRAEAVIDPMALNQFVAQGVDSSKLKFQWHSHGDSSVLFSDTDKDTMRGFFSDFMISMVVNKRGEYRCRIDVYEPFCIGFEVPISIIIPTDKDLIDECQKEIDQKISQKYIPEYTDHISRKESTTPLITLMLKGEKENELSETTRYLKS